MMKLLEIRPLTGEWIYFYKQADDLNAKEVLLIGLSSSLWAVGLSLNPIFSSDCYEGSGFLGVS